MDQWVPIINLPERWALSCKHLWEDLYLQSKSGVNPDGHLTTQRSKFQSTADGERNSWRKKKPLCLPGTYLKKGGESWGLDFHFRPDCLELHLSAMATKMRRRGACIAMRWEFEKACDAGPSPDGSYHVCLASVRSQRSGEKPAMGAVEWTKASTSLCRHKALVETLDLLQFHFFD